jgi:transposase
VTIAGWLSEGFILFEKLTDDEWNLLAGLIGEEPAIGMNRPGRPRVMPRDVVNGILWILTTREPWSKLPAHYPSGPTCRRRFSAWRSNGTLDEMVRLLSEAGRVSLSTRKVASSVELQSVSPVESKRSCDDAWAGVVWRAPESWQAPKRPTNTWRVDDAMASITRQLSGTSAKEPAAATVNPVGCEVEGSTWTQLGGRRRVTAFSGEGGLVIHAGIEELPNRLFRAWAEILKGNIRIERSGLIGPRFESADAAMQHALEWARQWIRRQDRSDRVARNASAQAADQQRSQAMSVTAPDSGVANPAVLDDQLYSGAPTSDRAPDPLPNSAMVGHCHFNQRSRLSRQSTGPSAAVVP